MTPGPSTEAVAAYAAQTLARLLALAEEHPDLTALGELLDHALQEAVAHAGSWAGHDNALPA